MSITYLVTHGDAFDTDLGDVEHIVPPSRLISTTYGRGIECVDDDRL